MTHSVNKESDFYKIHVINDKKNDPAEQAEVIEFNITEENNKSYIKVLEEKPNDKPYNVSLPNNVTKLTELKQIYELSNKPKAQTFHVALSQIVPLTSSISIQEQRFENNFLLI